MEQPIIWTHSGVFHADDVFALAVMQMMYRLSGGGSNMAKIIRSRTRPEKFTHAIDVGGEYDPYVGMYDHHQATGRLRPNGVKYAAVGLIWDAVGHHLIDLIIGRNAGEYGFTARDKGKIFDEVDAFFTTIDAHDNGQDELNGLTKAHTIFDVIKNFYPLKSDLDYWEEDAAFYNALGFAEQYLMTFIKSSMKRISFSQYVKTRIAITLAGATTEDCKLVMVLEKAGPFLATVNEDFEKCEPIKVVVYPGKSDDTDMWYIRTMPGSLTDQQCSKCPAPEEWRGCSIDELKTLTGVETVTFIHPAGFLGGCITKEDALKLATMWAEKSTSLK